MSLAVELGRILRTTRLFEPLENIDSEGMSSTLGRMVGDPQEWGSVINLALLLEQKQSGGSDTCGVDVSKSYFLRDDKLRWAWRVTLYGSEDAQTVYLETLYSYLEKRYNQGPVEVTSMPLSLQHKEGVGHGGGAYKLSEFPGPEGIR